MSLVNDALNQLPDKSLGNDQLKSPYSNPASKTSVPYKSIFILVLILIITAQVSYMVFSGRYSDQKQSETEVLTMAATTENIKKIVISGAKDQNVETDVTLSRTPNEQTEAAIIPTVTLQKQPETVATKHIEEPLAEEEPLKQALEEPQQAAKKTLLYSSGVTNNAKPDSKAPKLSQNGSNIETTSIAPVKGTKDPAPQEKVLNTSIIATNISRFNEDQIIRQAYRKQQQGNIKAAINLLSKALESEPDNLTIRLAVSKLWLNQNQPDKALDIISNRSDPKAIALQALIFETMQNIDKAIQLYQQLAESNDLTSGYQLRYAVLLENTRELNKAYIWYQTFSKNRDNHDNLRLFATERMRNIINTGQL